MELMVAMGLGAFLAAGVVSISEDVKKSYVTSESINSTLQQGHFALETIEMALRLRGNYGCLEPTLGDDEVFDTNLSSYAWDVNSQIAPVSDAVPDSLVLAKSSLRGFRISDTGAWLPDPGALSSVQQDIVNFTNLGDSLEATPRHSSDVFAVQYASSDGAELALNMSSTTSEITISGEDQERLNFQEGDVVYLGDCVKGDVFTITGVTEMTADNTVVLEHSDSSNESIALNNTYLQNPNVLVRRFNSDLYYIAETHIKTPRGDSVYGLYRYNLLKTDDPELVIEGVEYLRLSYELVLSSGNVVYHPPDAADLVNTGMLAVGAVKVSLLASSLSSSNRYPDTKTYLLDDQLLSSSDYQNQYGVKKVFSKVVQLKNRS